MWSCPRVSIAEAATPEVVTPSGSWPFDMSFSVMAGFPVMSRGAEQILATKIFESERLASLSMNKRWLVPALRRTVGVVSRQWGIELALSMMSTSEHPAW